jgi:hemoglobin
MHSTPSRPALSRLTSRLWLVAAAFTMACASMGGGTPGSRTPSLYARLGGYEALAAVVDDLLAREVKDSIVAPFFKGMELRDVQRVRQHLVDQLCAASGGPCYYPGRDMKSVHEGMEITETVWNAFTRHIDATLRAFKVGERERNELVVIVNSLKKDIVKPATPDNSRAQLIGIRRGE